VASGLVEATYRVVKLTIDKKHAFIYSACFTSSYRKPRGVVSADNVLITPDVLTAPDFSKYLPGMTATLGGSKRTTVSETNFVVVLGVLIYDYALNLSCLYTHTDALVGVGCEPDVSVGK
jgi:hypothetical protein